MTGRDFGVEAQEVSAGRNSARVLLRYDLEVDDDTSAALVGGIGGGHYSRNDLTYVTADLGLLGHIGKDEGIHGFVGPLLALSVPVDQRTARSDVVLAPDVDSFHTTLFGGFNMGVAVQPSRFLRFYIELSNWYGWEIASTADGDTPLRLQTSLLALSVGTGVRF
ncbi:hypothetical protein FIV42_19110 [Persicimonas caeni]|uniref:Uncharacterized protein n=1 Tax=Persicimonas caeni TaxID=2292766 RepID=A0A4Y6PYF4_PERCE|nr:hypothetical protein [Persicimonas caeni]QDG52775.1 hypothetical protein FIV42_19110 [Persicimonas caeni]QED33997.1 hypothetical protein FRD00_19105 [Persicimonas caeni]